MAEGGLGLWSGVRYPCGPVPPGASGVVCPIFRVPAASSAGQHGGSGRMVRVAHPYSVGFRYSRLLIVVVLGWLSGPSPDLVLPGAWRLVLGAWLVGDIPPCACGAGRCWRLVLPARGPRLPVRVPGCRCSGLLAFLGYLLSLVAEGSGGRWFWQLVLRVGFVDSCSCRPQAADHRPEPTGWCGVEAHVQGCGGPV